MTEITKEKLWSKLDRVRDDQKEIVKKLKLLGAHTVEVDGTHVYFYFKKDVHGMFCTMQYNQCPCAGIYLWTK